MIEKQTIKTLRYCSLQSPNESHAHRSMHRQTIARIKVHPIATSAQPRHNYTVEFGVLFLDVVGCGGIL